MCSRRNARGGGQRDGRELGASSRHVCGARSAGCESLCARGLAVWLEASHVTALRPVSSVRTSLSGVGNVAPTALMRGSCPELLLAWQTLLPALSTHSLTHSAHQHCQGEAPIIPVLWARKPRSSPANLVRKRPSGKVED